MRAKVTALSFSHGPLFPAAPPAPQPQPQPQPDPLCETDSDEEILEQILEPPLQHFRSKKLFSIPEEEEEEEEDGEEDGEAAQEEKGPGAGSASRDPGPPAPLPPGLGCDGARPRGPGLCASSCSPCRVGDRPEDPLGLVGGGSWRKGSGSPEKPPGRRRSPDHREHCSRLLSNGGGGSQAPGRATGLEQTSDAWSKCLHKT